MVYSFSELHDLENMAYEIHLQLSRELMCVEKNTTITRSLSSFSHMFAFKILIGNINDNNDNNSNNNVPAPDLLWRCPGRQERATDPHRL